MANIKIEQLPSGTLTVSIPQAISTALNLKKGEEVIWKINGTKLQLESNMRAKWPDGGLCDKNK